MINSNFRFYTLATIGWRVRGFSNFECVVVDSIFLLISLLIHQDTTFLYKSAQFSWKKEQIEIRFVPVSLAYNLAVYFEDT